MIDNYRLELEPTQNGPDRVQRILALAGSWNDMAEEDFDAFLTEMEQRRQQAFARRRSQETGVN
jgi:hypothetical protein